MSTLVTLTLTFLALAALARAIYYQVSVLRSMAWPYADEAVPSRTARPPKGTSAERMRYFLRDPEHSATRRTWMASWVWAFVFFFALLAWIAAIRSGAVF